MYFSKALNDMSKKLDKALKQYRAVLTPDYSMYTDMNPTIQLYNTFRNRWVGAYFKENGIKVIPTVSWGLENTFDFCFNGIDKGSIVAVSTYMVSEHGNRQDKKGFPDPKTKIDYFDVPVPEFKIYRKGENKMQNLIEYSYDDNKFESISDFKWSLIHGSEIVFDWKENSYGIFRNSDKRFSFSQANNQESEVICKSPDEILDIIIDGQKLREFITEVTVTHRNL